MTKNDDAQWTSFTLLYEGARARESVSVCLCGVRGVCVASLGERVDRTEEREERGGGGKERRGRRERKNGEKWLSKERRKRGKDEWACELESGSAHHVVWREKEGISWGFNAKGETGLLISFYHLSLSLSLTHTQKGTHTHLVSIFYSQLTILFKFQNTHTHTGSKPKPHMPLPVPPRVLDPKFFTSIAMAKCGDQLTGIRWDFYLHFKNVCDLSLISLSFIHKFALSLLLSLSLSYITQKRSSDMKIVLRFQLSRSLTHSLTHSLTLSLTHSCKWRWCHGVCVASTDTQRRRERDCFRWSHIKRPTLSSIEFDGW